MLFEITRKFTENGQEKTESMGMGDEATLKTLNEVTAKYPTKYHGSTFVKKETPVQEPEKKESKKGKD